MPLRSQRQDGAVTRARILEAAGTLFAAAGFGDTTSKAVAAKAEVDLASINYHFRSRIGLYQATLVEAHRRLIDVVDLRQLIEKTMSSNAKLGAVIELLVPLQAGPNEPWHLHLLAREVLAPSSNIHVLFHAEVAPKLSLVRSLVSDITGIPTDAPALSRCMLSLAAPCLMLLISNRALRGPFLEVSEMPRQAVIHHLHTYAQAGLAAVSCEYCAGRC